MIKNRELIQSVPEDKKLEMIADGNCLGSEQPCGGLPRVIPSSFEAVNSACGEIYPSYAFLANSWDTGLISAVSNDLALRARENGVNLLFTPAGNVKSNPYAAGVSEDPFYTGAFTGSIVKAARNASVVPCVTGCALTDCNADYLDVFPDARAIHTLFSPLEVFAGAYGNVFMTSFTRLSGNYERVNVDTVCPLLCKIAGDDGYIISSQTDRELTAESVAAGATFSYAGDAESLKAAVENYKSIKSLVEKGEAAQSDLDAACKNGSALSGEAIDCAADKIADFALYCNMNAGAEVTQNQVNSAELALRAAEGSIVLLKNDGALPLKGNERIGVIGQPAFIPNPATGLNFLQILSKTSLSVVGAAQGYNLTDERSDDLLQEAAALAQKCDTVLLFLGLDSRYEQELFINRRLKLPANRLALVGAIKAAGAKIIAVLTTAASVDVSFDGDTDALLIAPLNCMRGGEALINILSGKNPEGRLANTMYADTDGYFEKIKRDRDSGRIRIGSFFGYRYYSTAGIGARYPFGHGLGYTAFTYSDLKIQGEQILVTVKNTGSRDGSEVVQLYAGKDGSAVIRPAKELKSFIKLHLRAGEAKTLRFRLPPEKLSVYCPDIKGKLTEGGSYNVFVGSSVSGIKLSGKINIFGMSLKPDNARYSDYIPTCSNVVEGGYTLAPVQKVAPSGKKTRLAGLILMLIAAVGAFILAVLCLSHVLSFNDSSAVPPVLSYVLAMFIAGAILLIVSIVQRNNAKQNPVQVTTQKPVTVKAEENDSLDSLFDMEFGEDDGEEEENEQKPESDETEISKYLDDSLDFATSAGNLSTFCTERGLAVNIRTARKILSAFAATRLILLKSANHALNSRLLNLLCEFFGAQTVYEIYESCGGVEQFLSLGGGSILNTVESAAQAGYLVQPICVDGVEISEIGEFFTPFAKYLKNPDGGASLSLADGKKAVLSNNLWFVFALSENSYLKDADIPTAENACVLDIDLSPAAVKEDKTQFNTLSIYQFAKISQAAKNTYTLDEDKCWKKIDRLESFINSRTPFAIGNKVWQRLESLASAYLASGGDEGAALDCSVAAKLMVSACANLDGKLTPSDGSILSAVENIFGEEDIPEIKSILKYSGIAPARRTGNAGK